MSDRKIAYGSEVPLTVTNLHSLANSATAGWQSAVIDNTSDKFLDAMLYVVFDPANTAPANSKGWYIFVYSGVGTDYTYNATGAEGTITLPDVTTSPNDLRFLGFVPYITQDAVHKSLHFSVAEAFGGRLPAKWGVVIMNHSGAALAASGNTVKYYGVYETVV